MKIFDREIKFCTDCPFCSKDNEYGGTCNISKEYFGSKYSGATSQINLNYPIRNNAELEDQLKNIKLYENL